MDQPLTLSRDAAPTARLQTLAATTIVLWAVGTLFSEGVQQLGAVMAIALAGFLVLRRRQEIPRELLLLLGGFGLLSCWQLLTPALALATGAAQKWPSSGRYFLALDTLALPALAIVATLGVPWRALCWVLPVGWALQTGLSLFQHYVKWPWEQLGPKRFPLHRLHQSFTPEGEPVRYAGLGFWFHRLRFAFGAVALVGPAVAVAAGARALLQRLGAATLAGVLVACVSLTYTRAALGAVALQLGAAVLLLVKGKVRLALIGLGVLSLGLVLLSPAWQARLNRGSGLFVEEERSFAVGTGLRLVKANPILGVGFGNHLRAAQALHGPLDVDHTTWVTSSHNLLVTVWAETGLIGLALLLAAHLLLARALWRRWRTGSAVAAGGLLALVGLHGLGLFHYPPYHSGVMLSFYLFMGLGLAEPPPALAGAREAGIPVDKQAAPG